MKRNTFIAALLLVVAGVQTAWAQKVIIKLADDQTLKYKVSQVEYIAFEEAVNVEYVDLALPSGTLWASMNVGANAPEEYGDYFAWGEISPKTVYDWATYKYSDGTGSKLTKYCLQTSCGFNGFTDSRTELLPEDDAASYNWDENWQMPSYVQCRELCNSSYTTTEPKTVNGVDGVEIKSKFNGKSIFLPVAGCRYNDISSFVGSNGFYWTRTIFYDDSQSAYKMNFNFSSGSASINGNVRHVGFSVRPVRVETAAPIPVSQITLDKNTLSLNNDETAQLTATVSPINARNRSVTWSSSNTSVATVDQSGLVTALTKGNCTITCEAKDGSGVKATCSVTVKQLVTGITLNKSDLSLAIGEDYWLRATISPSDASTTSVTWTSSNENIATVSSTGIVTAVDKGICAITCTANDGSGVKATCAVTVIKRLTAITLSPQTLLVTRGSSRTITATFTPSDASNTNLTWQSSNTAIASVTPTTGMVNANNIGTCTITCLSQDGSGVKGQCEVKVTAAPQYVDLGLPSGTLWATFNIGANSPGEVGDYFAWGESDPNKDTWNYATYSMCQGSTQYMTKYNWTDNKKELEPEDDAATVIWGSEWQMPSNTQTAELFTNASSTWVQQDGVWGVQFKSIHNKKTIFFPAAGYYEGSSLKYTDTGNYWTRNLASGVNYSAPKLYFSSSDEYNADERRYCGLTIRPVRKQ